MKLKKGMLSGYRTIIAAAATIVGVWLAYFTGAPIFGQDVPLTTGAAVIATFWLAKDIFMRLGVKKAEKAAEASRFHQTDNSGSGMRFTALFLCGALAIGATGCAGSIARNEVLMPAIKLAADGVKSDCYRGIADAVADGDLERAAADELQTRAAGLWWVIADQDRDGIVERIPVWVELRPFGERGIQDMIDDVEIGTAGAASRIERLDLFGESPQRLAE